MTIPRISRPSRRLFGLAVASGLVIRSAQAQAPVRPVVVLFGDSIAAGYGLPPEAGLAAALQAELEALGVAASVKNAGIPGDTSAGGRGRMQMAVKRGAAVCVVEFGGNDRARGYPAASVEENLEAIIRWLQSQNTAVVLTGPGAGGKADDPAAVAFDAAFPAVAQKTGVLFYPDLMAGVSRSSSLRQADGIHPSAAGARVIAAGLAPLVVQGLRKAGAGNSVR